MKYILIILLVLLFSCQNNTSTNNNQITESEKQEVKDLILNYFDDIWSSYDTTKLLVHQTKDFILFEHGEVWKEEEIKEFMQKQIDKGDLPNRKNSMDFTFIEKQGENYHFAYHNFAKITRADTLVANVQWLESGYAIPSEDGLKLKFLHSTWVRPE